MCLFYVLRQEMLLQFYLWLLFVFAEAVSLHFIMLPMILILLSTCHITSFCYQYTSRSYINSQALCNFTASEMEGHKVESTSQSLMQKTTTKKNKTKLLNKLHQTCIYLRDTALHYRVFVILPNPCILASNKWAT